MQLQEWQAFSFNIFRKMPQRQQSTGKFKLRKHCFTISKKLIFPILKWLLQNVLWKNCSFLWQIFKVVLLFDKTLPRGNSRHYNGGALNNFRILHHGAIIQAGVTSKKILLWKSIEFSITLKQSATRYKQSTVIFLVTRSPTWWDLILVFDFYERANKG